MEKVGFQTDSNKFQIMPEWFLVSDRWISQSYRFYFWFKSFIECGFVIAVSKSKNLNILRYHIDISTLYHIMDLTEILIKVSICGSQYL